MTQEPETTTVAAGPGEAGHSVAPVARGRALGLAILGCGKAAEMHAKTLHKLALGVEPVFASRERARAEAFARRHGGPRARAADGYEAAMADAAVDAVLITTPPNSHAELAEAALAAGKHVIVEKPPFRSVAEFDRVLAAAAKAERRVLVAENYYYKPLRAVLQQLLVEEAAIGRVLSGYVNALKTQRLGAGDWRADAATAGGGALFEGGIHWINLIANMGLEPVAATGHCPTGPDEPDRTMTVTLDYAGGASATLLYSWEVPSPLQGLRLSRIYGTRGVLSFESNGLFVAVTGQRTRLRFPGLRDIAGYQGMFQDFIHALRAGREPAMTTAMARRDLALVEQAYATAQRAMAPLQK